MASPLHKKRIASFSYALQGIKQLFKSQTNARIHLILATLAIIMGFYFNINGDEWIAITLCISSVLAAELLNTAIEVLADEVDPEFNPSIGISKDLAAGAVLIVATAAAIIGGIIFIPKIMAL